MFKGQKPTFRTIDILTVNVDHSLNPVRFETGEKFGGYEVTGNLDLPGMKRDILAEGRIIEPVWIAELDGVPTVFRGVRRTCAAQEMKNDPNTPQGVLDALRQTPCWYFKNATRAEVLEAVNDQTSKRYATSGVIRWIWALQDSGKGYKELAPICWSMFESWPSKKMQSAIKKIQAMKEGPERDKEIQSTLMGTLNQEILLANRLGERVRNAYLVPYLVQDGLIPPDTKAEFKASRENLAKILEAQKADKESPEGWNEIEGGASFNAVLEDLAKPKAPAAGSTRPKASAVDEFLESLKCSLSAKIAKFVKEGVKNGTADEDDLVLRRQVCANYFKEAAPKMVASATLPMEQVIKLLDCATTGKHADFKVLLSTLTNG